MKQKVALVTGVSGQDGSLLSKFLLENNYRVIGTSRDIHTSSFNKLIKLGIEKEVTRVNMNTCDYRSVLNIISIYEPDEIYHLSGQSSVAQSFEFPVETLESICISAITILEAIRYKNRLIKFYNAGSSECFGNTFNIKANEETPFNPCSPYAAAKSAAFWQVKNYRNAYNLFCCTGILFNHESGLRNERFVTRKIVKTACRIYRGEDINLELGNINIVRDWGWAEEYVEVMHSMLQISKPEDIVIGTGKSHSLREFVDYAFASLGLDYKKYLIINEEYMRPTDLKESCADSSKAKKILNWKAKHDMQSVIDKMIKSELV